MTHVGPAPMASATVAPAPGTSFVEWSAVLAGAVLAAAISFVLLTFGAAIGLSAVSPWPNSGASTKVVTSVAIFWVMVQQIGAFMAGGYVAGRMRSRWREASQDEVEFRDGLHGGLVWATGLLVGALLFMATAGAAARTGVDLAGRAASAVGDPMDIVVDTMVRPVVVGQASAPAPAGAAATPTTAARGRTATSNSDEFRAEMSRILATSVASGSLSEQNRSYLVQLVAQRSGLPPQEAEKRVNEAFTAARTAADKARRSAVVTGLVTAVSLIVAFGAAWWGALKGGNHRDNAVPARFEFNRRRATPVA